MKKQNEQSGKSKDLKLKIIPLIFFLLGGRSKYHVFVIQVFFAITLALLFTLIHTTPNISRSDN